MRPGCIRSLQRKPHRYSKTHRCIMHGKAQPRDTNLERQRQLDEMYRLYKAESFPQVHLYIHIISGVIIFIYFCSGQEVLRALTQGEDITAEELYNLQRMNASRVLLVDTRSKPEQDVSIIPGMYQSA